MDRSYCNYDRLLHCTIDEPVRRLITLSNEIRCTYTTNTNTDNATFDLSPYR